MSLARGLDYYTGIIYEAITEASAPPSKTVNPPVPSSSAITNSVPSSSTSSSKPPKTSEEPDESTVGVGSIAAGGRYDNLVGMFSSSAGKKGDIQVPCVGISFGVERVYSILESKRKAKGSEGKTRGKETEVYVMALGGGLVKERMGFAKMLRDNGIKVSSFLSLYGGCVAESGTEAIS